VEHRVEVPSEPLKKLQGFDKIFLAPQEEKEVEIILNARSFSEWSLDKKEWEVKQGSYNIHIGASSKDIRLSNQINL
jgi:beta-glucosidase